MYMANETKSTDLDYEERLSPHFTVGEMLRSGTALTLGIPNLPPEQSAGDETGREEVMANLHALCEQVLEPLRRQVGRVIITSGYRCEALNEAVEGARHSQHLRGEAADIHVTGTEMCRKYAAILRRTPFDQLILEPRLSAKKRWIHVSYRRTGHNRHQVLGMG